MNIDNLRGQINKIDSGIVDLLAERKLIVERIAMFKKKSNMEILQPAREKEVLNYVKNLAREKGLSEELVEKIFTAILDNSRDVQSVLSS